MGVTQAPKVELRIVRWPATTPLTEYLPAHQRLLQGHIRNQGLHSLKGLSGDWPFTRSSLDGELPISLKTALGQFVALPLLAPASVLGCFADRQGDAEAAIL